MYKDFSFYSRTKIRVKLTLNHQISLDLKRINKIENLSNFINDSYIFKMNNSTHFISRNLIIARDWKSFKFHFPII